MWSLHVGCRAEPWTLGHSVVSAVEPGRPAAPGRCGRRLKLGWCTE